MHTEIDRQRLLSYQNCRIDTQLKMNCLLSCQSRLWIVTILFYTCILIPLMQLKKALASMFGLMAFFCCDSKAMAKEMEFPEIPSLPVARFQDVQEHSCVGEDGKSEEICSICLVEFEGEDAVSKLGRCGHIFHFNCIEQWLDRNQFSCPLCRSFLLSQHHVPTMEQSCFCILVLLGKPISASFR